MSQRLMQQEITRALNTLKQGGVILYPTDTVWGIGCDATNYDAVKKIYTIKQRNTSKALICLVSNYNMLKKHVNVPSVAHQILESAIKPTTIIYDNPSFVAKNLITPDNTIAIRIVKDEFCQNLIELLGKPLVSTSANLAGEMTPKSFREIDEVVLKSVDYVVNLQKEKTAINASTIIKLRGDGSIKIIRE